MLLPYRRPTTIMLWFLCVQMGSSIPYPIESGRSPMRLSLAAHHSSVTNVATAVAVQLQTCQDDCVLVTVYGMDILLRPMRWTSMWYLASRSG